MKRKKRHLSELELLTMKKILLSNAIYRYFLMGVTDRYQSLDSDGCDSCTYFCWHFFFDKTSIADIAYVKCCSFCDVVMIVLNMLLF